MSSKHCRTTPPPGSDAIVTTDDPPGPPDVLYVTPSEINYTKDCISSTFSDGQPLTRTFTDLVHGHVTVHQLDLIKVVDFNNQFYALDGNRRLYLFRKLEAFGKLREIPVENLDLTKALFEFPHFATICNVVLGRQTSVRRLTPSRARTVSEDTADPSAVANSCLHRQETPHSSRMAKSAPTTARDSYGHKKRSTSEINSNARRVHDVWSPTTGAPPAPSLSHHNHVSSGDSANQTAHHHELPYSIAPSCPVHGSLAVASQALKSAQGVDLTVESPRRVAEHDLNDDSSPPADDETQLRVQGSFGESVLIHHDPFLDQKLDEIVTDTMRQDPWERMTEFSEDSKLTSSHTDNNITIHQQRYGGINDKALTAGGVYSVPHTPTHVRLPPKTGEPPPSYAPFKSGPDNPPLSGQIAPPPFYLNGELRTGLEDQSVAPYHYSSGRYQTPRKHHMASDNGYTEREFSATSPPAASLTPGAALQMRSAPDTVRQHGPLIVGSDVNTKLLNQAAANLERISSQISIPGEDTGDRIAHYYSPRSGASVQELRQLKGSATASSSFAGGTIISNADTPAEVTKSPEFRITWRTFWSINCARKVCGVVIFFVTVLFVIVLGWICSIIFKPPEG